MTRDLAVVAGVLVVFAIGWVCGFLFGREQGR